MIRFPSAVYVATGPIDLRSSFDRLAGIIRDQLGGDPRAGSLFVFHNRRRTHLKLMWADPTGYCIFYKRLDRGTYRIPIAVPHDATHVSVSSRELAILLDGIDHALLRAARRSVAINR